MTLVLLAPHNPQLYSHLPGRSLTPEKLFQAPLRKSKPTSEWLKPIPKEDRPKTPEPNWSVPTNDMLEPENNWANALVKSYKDL
ncbi:hypothetical protein Tco_0584856, partial [Tanacetum coccineum]